MHFSFAVWLVLCRRPLTICLLALPPLPFSSLCVCVVLSVGGVMRHSSAGRAPLRRLQRLCAHLIPPTATAATATATATAPLTAGPTTATATAATSDGAQSLARERAKACFDVRALHHLLVGGEDTAKLRQQIEAELKAGT